MILKCHNCGAQAATDNPPKEYVCRNCGSVNVVPTRDGFGDGELSCIAPTGFEWKLPSGVIRPVIGEPIFVTAQGSHLSKKEYIEIFGIDPELAIEYMRKLGKEGVPGYVNTSSLGGKK